MPALISWVCLCQAEMIGSLPLRLFALLCNCRRDGFPWVLRLHRDKIVSPNIGIMEGHRPSISHSLMMVKPLYREPVNCLRLDLILQGMNMPRWRNMSKR